MHPRGAYFLGVRTSGGGCILPMEGAYFKGCILLVGLHTSRGCKLSGVAYFLGCMPHGIVGRHTHTLWTDRRL